MSDKEIPNSNNVVMYVKPGHIFDAKSAEVNGSAFTWNGRGEGLSGNWLEYFVCLSKEEQIEKIRGLIHLCMARNGGLAELNVGTVLEGISEVLDESRFLHRPSPPAPPRHPNPDPTHCELVGLPSQVTDSGMASAIGDMIADCVEAVHNTRSPSAG